MRRQARIDASGCFAVQSGRIDTPRAANELTSHPNSS
jgi:hypothetical protein